MFGFAEGRGDPRHVVADALESGEPDRQHAATSSERYPSRRADGTAAAQIRRILERYHEAVACILGGLGAERDLARCQHPLPGCSGPAHRAGPRAVLSLEMERRRLTALNLRVFALGPGGVCQQPSAIRDVEQGVAAPNKLALIDGNAPDAPGTRRV